MGGLGRLPLASYRRSVPRRAPRALLTLAALIAAFSAGVGESLAQEEPRPSSGDTIFVADEDTVPFLHAQHTDVACLDCHSTEDAHGTVTVSSIRDCRSCHHEAASAEPCTRCHERDELERSGQLDVARTLSLSVGTFEARNLPFAHAEHTSEPCATCHADGPALSAASVSCADCHEEHHQMDARCTSCHREAPEDEHPLAVHATCTGSGCHDRATTRVTATSMGRSQRSVCLACHQRQEDHRPGERCARCHLLPPATDGGER